MVNTGYCSITCKTCLKGCMAKTSINRNKGREETVVQNSCDHFSFRISIHTNSNYVSWIIGSPDRISFYMFAKCNECKQSMSNESTCESFEVKKYSGTKSCCGGEVCFIYEYEQTFFDPDIISLVKNVPVFGNFVPENIAQKVEKNLETATY